MDADLDRIMADGYLGDLTGRPIEEIRNLRTECQQVETALSFVRRMIQGRLDVVMAELRRREGGGDPADLSALIEQLPQILSDRTRAPGTGRLPQLLAPGDVSGVFVDRLDAIVAKGHLDQLPEVDDVVLDRIRGELETLERTVSDRRREVFVRVDAVQAELTRRYRTGEASVESLLT